MTRNRIVAAFVATFIVVGLVATGPVGVQDASAMHLQGKKGVVRPHYAPVNGVEHHAK